MQQFISGYGNECLFPPKDMCKNVYSSFIQTSFKPKIIQWNIEMMNIEITQWNIIQ